MILIFRRGIRNLEAERESGKWVGERGERRGMKSGGIEKEGKKRKRANSFKSLLYYNLIF